MTFFLKCRKYSFKKSVISKKNLENCFVVVVVVVWKVTDKKTRIQNTVYDKTCELGSYSRPERIGTGTGIATFRKNVRWGGPVSSYWQCGGSMTFWCGSGSADPCL